MGIFCRWLYLAKSFAATPPPANKRVAVQRAKRYNTSNTQFENDCHRGSSVISSWSMPLQPHSFSPQTTTALHHYVLNLRNPHTTTNAYATTNRHAIADEIQFMRAASDIYRAPTNLSRRRHRAASTLSQLRIASIARAPSPYIAAVHQSSTSASAPLFTKLDSNWKCTYWLRSTKKDWSSWNQLSWKGESGSEKKRVSGGSSS